MSIQPISPFQTNVSNSKNIKMSTPSFQMSEAAQTGEKVAKSPGVKKILTSIMNGVKKYGKIIWQGLKNLGKTVMKMFAKKPEEYKPNL